MILYNPTVSGSLLVTGSLTTTGTLTAQTLVVQTITSSVDFVTGSSVNGSLSSNTHQFTGSVLVSGSVTVGGALAGTSATFSGRVNASTLYVNSTEYTYANYATAVIGVRPNNDGISALWLRPSDASNNVGTALSSTSTTFAIGSLVTSPYFSIALSTGAATFSSGVSIGGADQGYQLDVKRTSTGDATFDTVANFYKASTHNTGLLLRLKNTIVDLAANNITGGGGPSAGMSFSVSSGGTISTALTLASTGAATFSSTITANGGNILSSGSSYGIVQVKGSGASTWQMFANPSDELRFGRSGVGDYLTITNAGAATFSDNITLSSGKSIGFGGNTIAAAVNALIYSDTNYIVMNSKAGSALYLNYDNTNASSVIDMFNGKMVVKQTGNVGIGTSSPSSSINSGVSKVLSISNTSQYASLVIQGRNGGEAGITIADDLYIDIAGNSTGTNNNILFRTTNTNSSYSTTERMRITSGGNVLIGGTTTLGASGTNLEISGGRAQLVVNSTTATASWFSVYPAGDGHTYIIRNTGYSYLFGTATNQATTGFVQQMSISSNGSIGAPSGTNIYNASDARLKKNISTTTYGLNAISALNPVKFNWVDGFEPTEDGKDMLGFVAQEVQEVLPEAIESFGGDINLNGTTITNPLRVNEKFIIPVLVKAIQELKAEIDTLKQQQ